MNDEYSCGAVIFARIDGQIRYCIMESIAGLFGFPKGHMEKGETEEETALREVSEEVGLKVTLVPGFRTTDSHHLPQKPGAMKHITYFLAEAQDTNIRIQKEELASAAFLDYGQAMRKFQFPSSRRILTEAHEFLIK